MAKNNEKKPNPKPFQFTVLVFFLCAGAVFFYYYTQHQRMTKPVFENVSPDESLKISVTRTAPGFLSINKYLYRFRLYDKDENELEGNPLELARKTDAMPEFNVLWFDEHIRVFDGEHLIAGCLFKDGKQAWFIPNALAFQESTSPDHEYLCVIKFQGSPDPTIIPSYFHFYILRGADRIPGKFGKYTFRESKDIEFTFEWQKNGVSILRDQKVIATGMVEDETQKWQIFQEDASTQPAK